ncbi:(Na+)-NQR maturation NqrM [Pontibacterium granulatum]|uniref:(Na+)-NQR maturation NqrM n=1 Tax=Pontibacterium granulatum TaxID=2036029 RepID=UPI00249C4153|nr:(Na+)-NQR maturation NqrM [Pontibacterium granulatum]MDI3324566.1 (Na+)-NQR maturation NqrM [Pontibacterium granulatum]
METVFLAFVVLLVVIVGASVGVLMGRNPIKGSCGGVGKAMGEENYICPVCGDDPNKCESENEKTAAAKTDELSYELTK